MQIRNIVFQYLNNNAKGTSCPSLCKAVVPSTLIVLTFSRNAIFCPNAECLSFRISIIFGCLKKATTLSL